MCLNCGCMRAHDDMGKPDVDASGATVDDVLDTIARTADKDRGEHQSEYAGNAAARSA